MSNKKRKCKHCNNYKLAQNGIKTPAAWFCSFEHAQTYAIKKAAQKRKREASEKSNKEREERRKRKEKLKGRRWYEKKAQQVFNKWIRDRDKLEPCISCQRYHTGQYHAGHYRTTAAAPQLRFDENNVFKQCSACNNYLSGNIGDYRINLIKKIGLKKVESLENNNDLKKWTIEELKDIIKKYKL